MAGHSGFWNKAVQNCVVWVRKFSKRHEGGMWKKYTHSILFVCVFLPKIAKGTREVTETMQFNFGWPIYWLCWKWMYWHFIAAAFGMHCFLIILLHKWCENQICKLWKYQAIGNQKSNSGVSITSAFFVLILWQLFDKIFAVMWVKTSNYLQYQGTLAKAYSILYEIPAPC